MRLDGNSILVADADTVYSSQLRDALCRQGASCFHAADINSAKELIGKYNFDVVIANYYLSDGIIHELIDWCAFNMDELPIFTCTGHPFAADPVISHNHCITEIFNKKSPEKIIERLSSLLFDFNQLHESLVELVTPKEIVIEFLSEGRIFTLRSHEISGDGLYFQLDRDLRKGTFGVLKFSLIGDTHFQNFVVPGFVEEQSSEGTLFRINKTYMGNWKKFLVFLNDKQINVNRFLKKAAGL